MRKSRAEAQAVSYCRRLGVGVLSMRSPWDWSGDPVGNLKPQQEGVHTSPVSQDILTWPSAPQEASQWVQGREQAAEVFPDTQPKEPKSTQETEITPVT